MIGGVLVFIGCVPGEILAINARVNVEIPGDPDSSDLIKSVSPGTAAAEQHATPLYSSANRRSGSNPTYNGAPFLFAWIFLFLYNEYRKVVYSADIRPWLRGE